MFTILYMRSYVHKLSSSSSWRSQKCVFLISIFHSCIRKTEPERRRDRPVCAASRGHHGASIRDGDRSVPGYNQHETEQRVAVLGPRHGAGRNDAPAHCAHGTVCLETAAAESHDGWVLHDGWIGYIRWWMCCTGVDRLAIVREILRFDIFPAFLQIVPHFGFISRGEILWSSRHFSAPGRHFVRNSELAL